MNSLVLIGRLARDPEMRYIPASGMAVTKFTLAVEKELSKEKKEELISQEKPTADFIPCHLLQNIFQKGVSVQFMEE